MLSFPWYWQKGFPASGLFFTYLGLYLMDGHGQPALLYLVPCTLGNKLCYLALGRLHSFWFVNRKEFFLFYSRIFFFPCQWNICMFWTISILRRLCFQVLLLYWVWWEVSWSTCGIMARRSCRHHHHHLVIFLENLEALDQSLSSKDEMNKICIVLPNMQCKEVNYAFLHSIRILTQYNVKITVKQCGGSHFKANSSLVSLSCISSLLFVFIVPTSGSQ
jgi:hypothetical protein